MIDCVSIGDSIALGVGQAAHCETHARVGVSAAYISTHYSASGRLCVISAGSNDPDSPTLSDELRSVRARVSCERVVWVVPQHPRAARLVWEAAAERGDVLVEFTPGRDGVHPRDYRDIARQLETLR